jgi:hypothetical protein
MGEQCLKRPKTEKKTNLETTQGISHNPFPLLSNLDVLHISKDTGICLGGDSKSEKQSVLEILDKDRTRKAEFDSMCADCRVDKDKGSVEIMDDGGINGEDAPCTPVAHIIRPQMGDASDEKCQWTYVGKKRKPKP